MITLERMEELDNERRAVEEQAKKREEASQPMGEGGPVTQYGRGFVTGITHRVPEMVGEAAEFVGADWGKELKEWARKGEIRPADPGAFYQAGEMTPASAAIPMAMGAVGSALQLIPHPVAQGAGWLLKVAPIVLTSAIFGLSQAQQTKETAEAQGIDPGRTPMMTGGIEATGEMIGTMALMRLLGPLAPAAKKASAPVKDLLKTSIVRFTKRLGLVTMPTEIGTEIGQQYGEAQVEKAAGIRPDAQPIKEAMSVIAPVAIMTLVSGAGGHTYQRLEAGNIAKKLADPGARPEERMVAAGKVGAVLSGEETTEGKPLSNLWMHYAKNQIDDGKAINLDKSATESIAGEKASDALKELDKVIDLEDKGKTAKQILTGETGGEENVFTEDELNAAIEGGRNDTQNIERMAGIIPQGEEPGGTVPNGTTGEEKISGGRILQAPETNENLKPGMTFKEFIESKGNTWPITKSDERFPGLKAEYDAYKAAKPAKEAKGSAKATKAAKKAVPTTTDGKIVTFTRYTEAQGFGQIKRDHPEYERLRKEFDSWRAGDMKEVTPDAMMKLATKARKENRTTGMPKGEKVQPEQASQAGEGEYDYSSTQIDIPQEDAGAIKALGAQIPDSEIYEDPTDPTLGRETNPHVTVKYGLHTANAKDVAPLLKDIGPIKAKMGRVSIFEADDYDVVKVDIESEDLRALNKKISDNLDVTDTHPKYQPHATIAYVKKGEGEKYIGNAALEGREIVIDALTFSSKDGKMYKLKLGVKAKPKSEKPTGPQNLLGRLMQKTPTGKYGVKVGPDYNRNLLRQSPDAKRVMREKDSVPLDEWVDILNSEGYNIKDDNELMELITSGRAKTTYQPERAEEMINRDIRREENEWIEKELANLEEQVSAVSGEEIPKVEVRLEGELKEEIPSEIASEGNLTEEQFQDSLTEWEAMMTEAKEASAKIPEKEKPALTPEGHERLPFTQTTIEGKEEPIFQKKEEEERKPESQGAMFTNLLGQELENLPGEEVKGYAGEDLAEYRSSIRRILTNFLERDARTDRGSLDKDVITDIIAKETPEEILTEASKLIDRRIDKHSKPEGWKDLFVGSYSALTDVSEDKARELIKTKEAKIETAKETKEKAKEEEGKGEKNRKQQVYDIIDHSVFKDIVPQAIQKDGQKVLDAMDKGDVVALEGIMIKYQKDVGRDQGGGGAGPGKVNQARRGAVAVWEAARKAIVGIEETVSPVPKEVLADYPELKTETPTEKIEDFGEKDKSRPPLGNIVEGYAPALQKARKGMPFTSNLLADIVKGQPLLDTVDYLLEIETKSHPAINAPDLVEGGPTTGKGHSKSMLTDVQFLRDIIGSDAFLKHGFSSLNIKTQRLMLLHMGRLSTNKQILDSVIQLVPVDVVNNLAHFKITPKMILHNPTVLKHALAHNLIKKIPLTTNAAHSLVNALTLAGAIETSSLTISDLIGPAEQGFSANATFNLDHAVTSLIGRYYNTRHHRENQAEKTLETKETEKGLQIYESGVEYTHENIIKEQLSLFGDVPLTERDSHVAASTTGAIRSGPQNEVVSVLQGYYKGGKKAETAVDIARIGQINLVKYPNEHVLAVITDKANNIINIIAHATGKKGSSSVDIGELAGQALNTPKAKNIWLLHQHPSGNALLSGGKTGDTATFDALANALQGTSVTAKDMVAVAHGLYSAYVNGEQEAPVTPGDQQIGKLKKVAREFKVVSNSTVILSGPEAVEEYAKKALPDGGIILIDTQRTPVATYEGADYDKLRGKTQTDILKKAEKRNATGMCIVSPHRAVNLENIIRFSKALQLDLCDVIDIAGSEVERRGNTQWEELIKKESSTFLSIGPPSKATVLEAQGLINDIQSTLHRILPMEAYRRINVELKPFVSLKGKNLEKTLAEWGVTEDLSPEMVYGATTFQNLNALVELSYNFDSDQIKKTNYHEIYHVARRWLFDDKTNEKMSKAFNHEEEEAIAFSDFAMKRESSKDKKKVSYAEHVFNRLKNILVSIRNALQGKGFTNPEDVFAKLYLGGYSRLQSKDTILSRIEKSGTLSSMTPKKGTALYSKDDILQQEGDQNGKAADSESGGEERDRVVSETRQRHKRRVGTERRILSEDADTPYNLREACGREGEGLTYSPNGYSNRAFQEAQVLASDDNLDVIPVTDTTDTFLAYYRDGAIFINMNTIDAGELPIGNIVAHEISHYRTAHNNSTSKAARRKIDTTSPAFIQYRENISKSNLGRDAFERGLRLTVGVTVEEYAADMEGGLKTHYNVTLEEGLKPGEKIEPLTFKKPETKPRTGELVAEPGEGGETLLSVADVLPDVVKERMERARGVPKTDHMTNIKEWGQKVKHGFAHFPGLETIKDIKLRAQLKNILRLHQEIPETAKDLTSRKILDFIGGLKDKQGHEDFRTTLILADLVRDLNNGVLVPGQGAWKEEGPFGFQTGEEIRKAYAAYQQKAEQNPNLKDALKKRRDFIREITQELVHYKILKPEALESDDYFHHQVIAYWGGTKGTGTSSKDVRKHWRGWMAARKGSILDYNTEYVEAEFAAVAQQLAQIETAKTLERLEKEANILRELKARAKAENLKNFYEMQPDPLEDPLKPYKAKIAMSHAKLEKMAADGTLEYDSEWTDLVEGLALSHEMRKNKETESEDFTTNDARWFPFLSYLIDTRKPGASWAATIYKAIHERNKLIELTLGDEFLTYRDMTPEGYTEWMPDPKKGWFWANTVADNVIQDVVAGTRDLQDKEVRRVLAKGKNTVWVIPEGLAETLDNFRGERTEETFLGAIARKSMAFWKQYILINPFSVLRYNTNNASGDTDICIAYAPSILIKAARATKDMVAWHRMKVAPGQLREEMEEARRLGVIGSGFSVQEVEDVLQIMSMDKFIRNIVAGERLNLAQKYWKTAQQATACRENILRLAAYRWFKEQIKAGKMVYGASFPKDVDAVTGLDEKAAKLARELLGDYGNLSKHGEYLRARIIPFYSWVEINAPRYVYMLRNLKHENSESEALKGVSMVAMKKTAAFMFKASLLFMLASLYNRLVWPDGEESLGEAGRRQLHLILGRREDGSVISLRFQGALSDALSFFGTEDLPSDYKDVTEGKSTIQEKMMEIPKAFATRVIQGIRPDIKMFAETLTGYGLYPDPFSPRPVRDTYEHVLRTFKLGAPYRWIAGKPKRGQGWAEQFANDIKKLLVYESDPGEQAYYDTRNLVFKWQEKNGKERSYGRPTKKGNTLYYYRQALKYGDLKAAEKYKKIYVEEFGGTQKGITRGIKSAYPLTGIALRDRHAFRLSLTPKENEIITKGIEWFGKTYR